MKISILDMGLKISNLRLQLHLPGVNKVKLPPLLFPGAKLQVAILALNYIKEAGLYQTRQDELTRKRAERKGKEQELLMARKQRIAQRQEEWRKRERKGPPLPKNAIGMLNDRYRGLKYNLMKQEGPTHAAQFTVSLQVSDVTSKHWGLVVTGEVKNKCSFKEYIWKCHIQSWPLLQASPPGAVFCGGWPKMVALTGV